MNDGDKQPTTSLSGKNYEPLVIRKYMRPYGFPVFVAMICGDDLTELDHIHDTFAEEMWNKELKGIQDLRNYFGEMSQTYVDHFKKAEGVAVIAFADKMVISSLWGDLMTHLQCRIELYSLIQTTTNV